MSVTALHTVRFELFPPTAADVPALAEHWRRPEVRRYLWDDMLVTLDVVHDVVATSLHDHASHGWGGWVLRDRESSRVIGWCGLRVGPPDGSVTPEPLVELFYSLEPDRWGTGAVVEAASAVLDHMFSTTALDEVFAGFDRPNLQSGATLQRLGFTPDRELLLDTGPTPYWRLNRADWRARLPQGLTPGGEDS